MGLRPSILLQGGVWILREIKFSWQNSTNSPETWNIWSLFSREGLPPTIHQWFKIRSPTNMLMMLEKFKRKNMCFFTCCQLVNTYFSWANTNQQFWAHFPIIPKHLNFCWEDFLTFTIFWVTSRELQIHPSVCLNFSGWWQVHLNVCQPYPWMQAQKNCHCARSCW